MLKEEFLSKVKSKGIHYNENNGFEYDYSLIPDNFKSIDKIPIVCKKHGRFEQIAKNHIFKQGCPICGKIKNTEPQRKTKEQFIYEAQQKHQYTDGEPFYDYSLVEYVQANIKVKIICPIHGQFKQTPNHHLHGTGCPKCGIDFIVKQRTKTLNEFISEANLKHNNFYDYSLVDYINSQTKVKIICPIHGEFEQQANSHLQGRGCPKCKFDNIRNDTEYFIKSVINKKIHLDDDNNLLYDYSLVDYKHSEKPIKIICKKHGIFEQWPSSHLQGRGCPTCGNENTVSKPEKFLRDFINNELNIETINNSRKLINGKEIDIFIENKNIGFEFNGIYIHQRIRLGDEYHFQKYNDSLSKNIKLYHIFEDEYINNIESVKSFIIKKLMIKKYLKIINEFSRKELFYNDLQLNKFLQINDANYKYIILSEKYIYHCLFDENNNIIKCYIINKRTKTIIKIVEKNYVIVKDRMNYFIGYNFMIDLFYDNPLEEQFKNFKIKEIIKPEIIEKMNYSQIYYITNCGYIIYEI